MKEIGKKFSYPVFLKEVKHRVLIAQRKAVYAVNKELIQLYWDIGKMIADNMKLTGWGDKAIERLSKDLKNEFPKVKGFSKRNCGYMLRFYREYDKGVENAKLSNDIVLPITKISWTHNVILLEKVKDWQTRYWYMFQSIKEGWDKRMLMQMISDKVHEHYGILPNNFDQTLPAIQAKQVQETLKDPYILDMLTLTEGYNERDIELGLIQQIEKFLLELGRGFAFVGRQYHLEVDGKDYYMDLLFYHIPLHCYFVVDLKNVPFEPEFAGKMNFYCSAVDDLLKGENDNATVGLILCKSKKRLTAQYSLRDIQKPIGVSQFELPNVLPANKLTLPSLEELEERLNEDLEDLEDLEGPEGPADGPDA